VRFAIVHHVFTILDLVVIIWSTPYFVPRGGHHRRLGPVDHLPVDHGLTRSHKQSRFREARISPRGKVAPGTGICDPRHVQRDQLQAPHQRGTV
jgi:hypothetical protein